MLEYAPEQNIVLARKAWLELQIEDCMIVYTESPNTEYKDKALTELNRLKFELKEVEEWLLMHEKSTATIH